MKCSACGKEYDEGFAYCPWCGSSVASTQEAANFKRIAVEEKLRDLRRNEIWSAVAGSLGLFGGLVFIFLTVWEYPELRPLPALMIGIIVFMLVVGAVCIPLSYRYNRKRQDLLKKLEKGKSE